MKKYLILVGPSYSRNSGYKVRVDRFNEYLRSKNNYTEIHCIQSPKTFFTGFAKTFNEMYDLILIENIALVAIVLMNFKSYSKCVLDYHGSIYDASFRKTFFLRKQLYLFFEFIAVTYFKKIIVISAAFKNQLKGKYDILEMKEKTFIIPNIPNISQQEILNYKDIYTSKKGILRIAYVGNNQSWQKIPELLSFIHRLNNFIEDSIELTIATNNKEWFTNYVKKCNYNFKIIITYIKSDNLLAFLNNQDFLLMLREENEINKVACPTKAIEYLLSYTPIIVSRNLGDISSLVETNNKGVVLSDEWSNLSNLNRIKKFIENYERRPGLIELLNKNYYDILIDL